MCLAEEKKNKTEQQMRTEEIRADLAQPFAWDIAVSPGEEAVPYEQQRQNYYRRIMESANLQNVSYEVRQADREKTVPPAEKLVPKERMAVAKKDCKFGSTETVKVKAAAKTFWDADLCTAREHESLGEYFKAGGYKSVVCDGIPGDEALGAYVDKLLTTNISEKIFNDEYLSTHMAKLYDFCLAMEDYGRMKERYPAFFMSLAPRKLLVLTQRKEYAVHLKSVLDAHLRLHGLSVEQDEKGRNAVVLRDTSKEPKEARRRTNEQNKKAYEDSRDAMFSLLNEKEAGIAALVTADAFFDSKKELAAIEDKIVAKPERYDQYRQATRGAYLEVQRAMDIREELREKQKELLSEYTSEKDEAKKRKLYTQIKRNNDRIGLASRHIEHYADAIDYLGGYTQNVSKGTREFLDRESGRADVKEAFAAKMIVENLPPGEESYLGFEVLEMPEKEKWQMVRDREYLAVSDGVKKMLGWLPGLGKSRSDKRALYNGKPFFEAYKKLSDAQKENLRIKKKYVHEYKTDEQKHSYEKTYNMKGAVGDAIRKYLPNAYRKIDAIRGNTDEKAREVDLFHAQGTQFLNDGHDVLEFDVGGSGYHQLPHMQNGYWGSEEHSDEDMQKQYGQIYRPADGSKVDKLVREKRTTGKGEHADRWKYRYTMAGPGAGGSGMFNTGDYAIDKTMERIRSIGIERLGPMLADWRDKGVEPHPVDIMLRGHSRGGVGAVMGAMKLKHWLHENFKQYEGYVKFHLIQMDPVPGSGSNWGGYEKVDHKEEGSHHVDWYGDGFMPLGDSAETTVIYSMHTQHTYFFTPQEISGVKRMILTPFDHQVGLSPDVLDYSQTDQGGEKVHAQTFYDAATGNAYRQSGLNSMPEGLYIMDEHHVLVRINKIMDYINIVQETIPTGEYFVQYDRHMVLLRAAAAKLGVPTDEAVRLWNENLQKRAAA